LILTASLINAFISQIDLAPLAFISTLGYHFKSLASLNHSPKLKKALSLLANSLQYLQNAAFERDSMNKASPFLSYFLTEKVLSFGRSFDKQERKPSRLIK
jgi:hypothetical protein